MKDLSVVIPTRNRAHLLQKCLDRVEKIPLKKEVIVVDSSDRPVPAGMAGISYYYEPDLNISQARQFGVEKSNSDFALQVDDDITYAPKAIVKMLEVLKGNSSIAVAVAIGPRWGFLLAYHPKEALIDTVVGGNLVLLRKSLFDSGTIRYDPRLTAFEDRDVLIQAWLAGYRAVYVLEVKWNCENIKTKRVPGGNPDGEKRLHFRKNLPLMVEKYPFAKAKGDRFICSLKSVLDYRNGTLKRYILDPEVGHSHAETN